MKKSSRIIALILTVILTLTFTVLCIFADTETNYEVTEETEETEATEATDIEVEAKETNENDVKKTKAIAAAIIIGVVASVGAVAMAISVKKAVDGTARQPEAAGNIRTSMMMGLVFIETAIIYALIVAILVIFVL